MISRTLRQAPSQGLAFRRNFTTSRIRFREHPHYPEGPRSNIPFDPLHKYFAFKFWGFCATGFFLPFGIAVWQTKKGF